MSEKTKANRTEGRPEDHAPIRVETEVPNGGQNES
jgi:hypothetical protein